MHENLLLLLLYFFKSRSRRTNLWFSQPLLNIRVLSCLHLHPQKKKHRFRFADYRTGSPLTPNIFIRLRFTFTSVASKRCSTYLQITRSATSMLTSKCVCVCDEARERESRRDSLCPYPGILMMGLNGRGSRCPGDRRHEYVWPRGRREQRRREAHRILIV